MPTSKISGAVEYARLFVCPTCSAESWVYFEDIAESGLPFCADCDQEKQLTPKFRLQVSINPVGPESLN